MKIRPDPGFRTPIPSKPERMGPKGLGCVNGCAIHGDIWIGAMDTAFWPFLLLVSLCQSIERSKLPLFSQVDYVTTMLADPFPYIVKNTPLKSSGLSRPHCCLIAPNSWEAWK